ncbi:MAG: tetratricopeptide repeat protein [Deltaproteobacteria bacterium]|nr:tetratricopeptide repeat protein [Deltaproteobacteria bacterium]
MQQAALGSLLHFRSFDTSARFAVQTPGATMRHPLLGIGILLTAAGLIFINNALASILTPQQKKFSVDSPVIDERVPAEIRTALDRKGLFDISRNALQAEGERLGKELRNKPDDPYLLHALGTVAFHLQGEREATALWKAANTKDANLAPADLMLEIQRFHAMRQKGEMKRAQAQLEMVEKRFAREPHFLLLRAEQAMRGRNFEAAGRSFALAHEISPRLYVTALNLGRYHAFMGDNSRALPLFQDAADLAPGRAETWWNLGMLQAFLKNDTAALEAFMRLRGLLPGGPFPETRLAEIRLEEMDFASAEKWLRQALSRQPAQPEKARVQSALGNVLLRRGAVAEAREQIVSALEYREQVQLLFALGTINEEQGRWKDAEKHYRRVLEIVPDNPLAQNNLAMLLLRRNRSLSEALTLAERARGSVSGNAIIEGTYGCALSRAGRHAEAIKVLGPVVESVGGDAWARYFYGVSLRGAGRTQDAATVLRRLLHDEPDFELRGDVEKML